MNTGQLKRFAQQARKQLMEQVAARMKVVLQTDSAELRGREKAITQLKKKIEASSQAVVVERVAYTWFNRFCALRFMDVNHYTSVGVVSPAGDFTQPEILQEAKQGHIDDDLQIDKKRVFDLLTGQISASDPQQEAYRMLLVAECNRLNVTMPFLFQHIDDYTELLLMEDLLSEHSILTAVREALNEEKCQDVEVIGWLYQFYISEKKDEVFEGLKKNKKITPENIPAATQLFTPHWIVRYLVENSLGRLWMLNRPTSRLAEKMDYYIKPEQAESDFLRIDKPEEIKICDPACGSGHMLTYAFDLLYEIYEEEGYEAREIPGLILSHNLYGIEIDKRAGDLAAFALTMKARGKYRRFFRKKVQPHICVLQNVQFDEGELKPYIEAVGRDLFTKDLSTLLHQFEEADNFGSLIRPVVSDVAHVRRVIQEKRLAGQVAFTRVHPKVMTVLKQAEFLSPRYHVVIANPPYMGNRSLNGRLQVYAKDYYPNSKADLFAMFMERSLAISQKQGLLAMINMQSWLFLGTFEQLRTSVLSSSTILTMAHIGERGFDTIGGAVVSTTAFVLQHIRHVNLEGVYVRLVDGKSESEKSEMLLEAIKSDDCGWRHNASTSIFENIEGKPIAYWLSDRFQEVFVSASRITDFADTCAGLQTSDNNRFLRLWHEVDRYKMDVSCCSREEAATSNAKWFPCTKGGGYRRWYGLNDFLVNWENDGDELFEFAASLYGSPTRIIKNAKRYFESGLTWSSIAPKFSIRYCPSGFIFETKGSMCFPHQLSDSFPLLALLNSKIVEAALKVFSPTLDFHEGPLGRVPAVFEEYREEARIKSGNAVKLSQKDWNSYETSWDFTTFPLLDSDYRQQTLRATYQNLRTHWQEMTLEMQRLEEENNRIFIEAYGLQDELTPEVQLKEITLTCNPHYRYGGNKTEGELEALLLADTMRELISYAVGCMFGRYALDKPGLILANQGESIEDYLEQIPEPSFLADDDNVIPILDANWFMDDIVLRFRKFLRVTFGEEQYEENLRFIEEALGKDIRKYFLKDFYADHIKRYKKRPIYWLFASPKGSFNALIYMHRYRPDTVSVILNDYLREFRSKLENQLSVQEQLSISASASKTEKTRAFKEIEKLKKVIAELQEYENTILYPLATEKIEIDLDDGVKTNYPKFGKALKKVAGLN